MPKFEAKLTNEQRGIIRGSTASAKELADQYKVTPQTVYNLRSEAREEAKRMEQEAMNPSRIREGTVRDLSEWDDMSYSPETSISRFHVPADIIPPGFEYQWNTCEVFGQPMPQRISWWQKQGWRPVPSQRHAGRWTPLDTKAEDIVVDGMMLMERPKAWCDRAREFEYAKARTQMDSKKAQLRGGDIPGVTLDATHPSARAVSGVKSHGYERITIPDE